MASPRESRAGARMKHDATKRSAPLRAMCLTTHGSASFFTVTGDAKWTPC